jgi:hypothetical protein
LEPYSDGGLNASIPLRNANHLKQLWEIGKFDQTDPESGWFSIDKFTVFNLSLMGHKFRPGLFGKTRWYTKCSMIFLKDDNILHLVGKDKHLYIPYVGCAITNSIAELCPLVDRVMRYEWPFVSKEVAFGSVGITI